MRLAKIPLGVLVLASVLTVGCAGGGSPTSPSGGSTTPTNPVPTPTPTPAPAPTAPATSGLIVPGTYSIDTVRTCVNGAQCNSRSLPTGLFSLSNGVLLNQMRGHVRFYDGGTFYFETVQRTDSPLGKGEDRTETADGLFNVTGSLIGFKTLAGHVAPGTMTISNDGTLLRFYDIPIALATVPTTIQVTETYRLVRE